jgi:uncharacterized protein YabE (DUF348 family)
VSARSLLVRPLVLGLTALAVLGGQHAYAASATAVTVSVDGHRTTVRTHGATVRDVLHQARLAVGAHDLLVPSPGTRLNDRTTIVLRRGREMQLSVDGAPRTIWVTAMSVDEALDQIGLRTSGAVLSADRSRSIPLKGFSLDIKTRKTVQLLDAGRVRRVVTNTVQVQQFLHEAKVQLARTDKLSVLRSTPVRNNMVIAITRIHGRQVGEDEAIGFRTVRRPDSGMYKGTERTLREGRVGVLHRTYALTYVNGKLASKRLAAHSVRTAAPVDEIVAYGTRSRPAPRRSVSGADGLNWGALANCESGGNPRSVSGGGEYRGLYQFSLSTWHGVGGSGDPIDASSSEQTYRAKLLYQRAGRSPWPVCGRYL